MIGERMTAVRQWMEGEGLAALLVSSGPNVRYLTGFSGEGLLVVDDEGALVCTDSRYAVQAGQEAPDLESATDGNHLQQAIARLECGGHERVGFEAAHLSYASFQTLSEKLDGVELKPCEDEIKRLRAVKHQGEIALIERAAGVADAAFEQWRRELQPGIAEREAALELERLMVLGGAEGASFETIVATGPNGAKPHARPGPRKIQGGDMVVVDWGAVVDGYCSDCTRTVIVDDVDDRQREVWEAVREAQQGALAALQPGMTGREADSVAREALQERGLAEHFKHGLGHGVGLEVHELPRLSEKSEDTIDPGMVVTIEPGVYIEGWGGVRLEELVLVTEEGGRAITAAGYDL
ncbi:MAG: Xaa-Pro peptidase family protein [Armatimonadota bacterium]|nr:Xaa-Pro peptidase family protein [Armatimonadota bacterium]